MIRSLQKMKAKRGFTMVELIVILAVLAILAAMILPGLDTTKALKKEANSAARDMYNVAQSIFTKYSLYEAPLNLQLKASGNTAEKDGSEYSECVRFYKKAGGNFPCFPGTISVSDMPKSTELYMEIVVSEGSIDEVNVAASSPAPSRGSTATAFLTLMQRGTATQNSTFGIIFMNDLESRMDVHDGYYYLRVNYTAPTPIPPATTADYVNPIKVVFAAYTKNQLPTCTSAWSDYEAKNLTFTKQNQNAENQIIGVFGGEIYTTDISQKAERGVKGTTLGHDVYYPS